MMPSSHHCAAARGMLAAAAVALLLCCRKSEAPGPPAAAGHPAGAPQAAAPAAPSGEGASIRDAAEPNRPPFSGFHGARGIALDGRGRVWLLDFEHAAVSVYDTGGGFHGGWGGKGDGPYQLKDPCGIAVRGEDVYVADTWNGRVTRFTLAGAFQGKAPGDFYGPRGVAVAPDGRVWIADTGNDRAVVCEKDLSGPKYFGKKGDGPDQFSSPVGIAVGPSGHVYVADSANRRIQVIDADGRFRSRIPVKGWGPNTEPYVQVDARENLYVTDPAEQAVIELDRNGKEIKRWTADDAGKKFSRPTGIALDEKNGVLWVVNTDLDTIVKLKLS